MMIIGCDYHPAFQQIAFVDTETGELRRAATAAPRRKRRSSTVISRPRE